MPAEAQVVEVAQQLVTARVAEEDADSVAAVRLAAEHPAAHHQLHPHNN